jgi:Cft2 family RNA processing exonuclease
MTMFIDESLLERVMKLTGFKTKTETVEFALREMERKKQLAEFVKKRNVPAHVWAKSLDPKYDLMAVREADKPRYPAKRGSR